MATYEEIVLAYVAAWDETDEEQRRALLEKSWAANGIYTDPRSEVVGREALIQHIGSMQQHFPGQHIRLTSGVDQHHARLRFTWARVNAEGQRVSEGIDFGEVSSDGRLTSITGFFGPPLPLPSS